MSLGVAVDNVYDTDSQVWVDFILQLLYDGMPLNQADGSFIIGLMDPEQARFVSVYRGANAMRYGGTTLGGAVDFRMRTARNTGGSFVRYETGSWGMGKLSAALLGKGELTDGYLQASRSESDGWRDWSQAERTNVMGNVGRVFEWGENRTYLHLTDNHFNAPFLLSKDRALNDPRSVLGDWDTPFDEHMDIRKRQPWRDTQQYRLSNKTTWIQDNTTHTLGVYAEKIEDELKNPVMVSYTDATNYGFDYGFEHNRYGDGGQLTQYLAFAQANMGAMPRAFDSIAPSDGRLLLRFADVDQKAANMVFGGQVLHEFRPRWQALASVQVAHNRREVTDHLSHPGIMDSTFKFWALNPKLGLIYRATDNRRYFVNWSGSSEAPTFWQLAVSAPDPNAPLHSYLEISNLKMQTGRTLELGTATNGERLSWEATWYYAFIEDELIAEVKDFAIDGTTVNYDHRTIHQGVELAFNAKSERGLGLADGQLEVRGVYNWSDFRFDGGRYDGNRIAGVPEHLVFGELGYWFTPRWFVGTNLRWQPTSTYVDHSNSGLQLDDYLLLGAKVTWKPTTKLDVFVDARNITGETYQTAYVVRGFSPDDPNAPTFVPGPDFSVIAGISMNW